MYVHVYMYVSCRVNKEYIAVLNASLSVTDASSEPEWVQLYTGIARGLGNLNVNITECVEDGNITVATFKAAFDAFEDRRIFDGKLNLIINSTHIRLTKKLCDYEMW